MSARTLDFPALCRRAAVGSINEANRTTSLVFSTGAAVARVDAYGTRYREVLSLAAGAVRLERLNAGGPLLNSHSAFDLADVIGTVEPGSAHVDGRQAVATVRFSRRADVEPIWQDVKDRIIRNVSIGYLVHKFEESKGAGGVITRTASDWEPYELSLVPMPADAGAQVRNGVTTTPCVIVSVSASDATADADRIRRLRLAVATTHAPLPSGPTEAHWRAVRVALEKFLGHGKYRGLGEAVELPRFEIRFDDPAIHPDTNGSTHFLSDGGIVVCLRSDRDPADVHRTTLHELMHVRDYDLITALPREVIEARASAAAERMAWWPW